MIVRILGEAQFDVADTEKSALDVLEHDLNTAVEGHDEAAFTAALAALIDAVRRTGNPLAPDAFISSDLVVPFSDSTLDETKALLREPGGEHP